MNDASGKYGGGYFFGNSYWMGSQTMCTNLAHNTSAHRKDVPHLAPPFAAAFFVLRADLSLPQAVAETVRVNTLCCALPAAALALNRVGAQNKLTGKAMPRRAGRGFHHVNMLA